MASPELLGAGAAASGIPLPTYGVNALGAQSADAMGIQSAYSTPAYSVSSSAWWVQQEDCDFTGIVTGTGAQDPSGLLAPDGQVGRRSWPAVMAPPAGFNGQDALALPPGGQAPVAVYVQDSRHQQHFRAISPERARRVYGLDASSNTLNGRLANRTSSAKRVNPLPRANIAVLRATALDADTAQLAEEDAVDRTVLELLTKCEGCKLSAAVMFFACQGLLSGLCLVLGCLAFAATDEGLVQALLVLEPYLTGFSTALAEVSVIGYVLRVLHSQERTRATEMNCESDDQDVSDERDLNRQAWGQAALGLISAICNMLVLVVCLLGTRNGVALLHYGPSVRPGEGSWEWHVDGARLFLRLRAGFGLFALGPAVLDARLLVMPLLPLGATTGQAPWLDVSGFPPTDSASGPEALAMAPTSASLAASRAS